MEDTSKLLEEYKRKIEILEEEKLILRKKLDFRTAEINNANSGLGIMDEDGNFLQVNKYYSKILGYSKEEFLQMNCISLSAISDIDVTKDALEQAKIDGFINNVEKRCFHKNGSLITIEMSLHKIGDSDKFVVVMNNIDVRKQFEASLLFAEILLDTVPVPIYVKDKNFKIIQCNDAYAFFLNQWKDDIIGQTIFEIEEDPDMAEIYHEQDLKLLEDSNYFEEMEIVNHKNETIIVEFHKAAIYKGDEFDGLLGIIIDVTDRKFKENYLGQQLVNMVAEKVQQEEAYTQDKLDNAKFTAIGQLAAGITHEINTPLTYIKGNFELLSFDIQGLEESSSKNRMIEDTVKISDGITRIANIVESMREMSQKSKETLEKTNIFHTLVTSLTMAYNRSKQVTKIFINGELFDVGLDKEKYILMANVQKQRVEQVWVVVINNALDELVKIENFDDRRIDINVEETDNNVVVTFHDNAGGIPEDMIENIFDAFVSNKESGGMGVGLNVAKKIIEDQNGTIMVKNKNDGALFTIKFPL